VGLAECSPVDGGRSALADLQRLASEARRRGFVLLAERAESALRAPLQGGTISVLSVSGASGL
jgi:hypothetical protein